MSSLSNILLLYSQKKNAWCIGIGIDLVLTTKNILKEGKQKIYYFCLLAIMFVCCCKQNK